MKRAEVRAYLQNEAAANIVLCEPPGWFQQCSVDEIQGTLDEIVRHKLRAAVAFARANYESSFDYFVVEDTSLEMDAMSGFPGPYIKDMWRGLLRDSDGLQRFCRLFAGTEVTIRTALAFNCFGTDVATGEQRAFIVRQPEGDLSNFDCVLSATRDGPTFAMDASQKTFRAAAVKEFVEKVREEVDKYLLRKV
jgi:inosine/xanthosine triphosphate pyrophosphatase family protein